LDAAVTTGLREFRGAFVAGSLWLIGLWFVIEPRLTEPSKATGVLAQFYKLLHLAGEPVTIAGVAIAAYIVGLVSLTATRILFRGADVIFHTRVLGLLDPERYTGRSQRNSLSRLVIRHLAERLDRDDPLATEIAGRCSRAAQRSSGTEAITDAQTERSLVDKLRSDLSTRERILSECLDLDEYIRRLRAERTYLLQVANVTNSDLSAVVNRQLAESDFRYGLVLPIFFISTVLAVKADPYWLLGVLVAWALSLLADSTNRAGTTLLFVALGEGKFPGSKAEQILDGPPLWRPLQAR
jgi:hypothetical protein